MINPWNEGFEVEDDEDAQPMTWLAKRHNEIVRERYPEDEEEDLDAQTSS